MTETEVRLNVQEMGVILSALQQLEMIDERRIEREFGSVGALYQRLNKVWERMDQTETGIRYEVEPSF